MSSSSQSSQSSQSSPVFSRTYLQSVPELCKQKVIENIINEFIQDLESAAAMGKTSYFYHEHRQFRDIQTAFSKVSILHSAGKNSIWGNGQQNALTVTNDDLISAFQQKFPGCDITQQNEWVDTNFNTRTLNKGILIDWS
jgi:hypothetical protein